MYNVNYFIFILFLFITVCASHNNGYCQVGRYNDKFFNGKNIKTIINFRNKYNKGYGLYSCQFHNVFILKCKLNIPNDFDDEITIEFEPIVEEEEQYLVNQCHCNTISDITLRVVKKRPTGKLEYGEVIDMFDKESIQEFEYIFGDGRPACKLNYRIKEIKGKCNSITYLSQSNISQYSSKGICVVIGNLYTTINSYYRAKPIRYLLAGLGGGLLCSGAVDLYYNVILRHKLVDPDYYFIGPSLQES